MREMLLGEGHAWKMLRYLLLIVDLIQNAVVDKAIQAAVVLVPLWVLRNAMMMDVLPQHSIGVWVSSIDAKHGKDAGKVAPFTKGQFIHLTLTERAKILCAHFAERFSSASHGKRCLRVGRCRPIWRDSYFCGADRSRRCISMYGSV